jgi:hypothetical protein
MQTVKPPLPAGRSAVVMSALGKPRVMAQRQIWAQFGHFGFTSISHFRTGSMALVWTGLQRESGLSLVPALS